MRLISAQALCMALLSIGTALAQCPPSVPSEGAVPPGPLPVFPSDNWWNTAISSAPIDPSSSSFIAFVNNGGSRRLHPDFGGEASPGSVNIYGMPYAIVDGSQPKQSVTFQDWSESDGVNYSTRQGVPFYPIPAQAITQPHWVEGGAPGNVDQRSDDRQTTEPPQFVGIVEQQCLQRRRVALFGSEGQGVQQNCLLDLCNLRGWHLAFA